MIGECPRLYYLRHSSLLIQFGICTSIQFCISDFPLLGSGWVGEVKISASSQSSSNGLHAKLRSGMSPSVLLATHSKSARA